MITEPAENNDTSLQLPPLSPLQRIDHVVVLMLENRSFDNLLGWLYRDESPPRGQPFEGLHTDLVNPVTDAAGRITEQVHVDVVNPSAGAGYRTPNPNPEEGFFATNEQLFGVRAPADGATPDNRGFANSYIKAVERAKGSTPGFEQIMQAYHPRDVPALATLAREYAVCDHWFSSVPSQTLPNRAFVHTGSSSGAVDNYPDCYNDSETVFNRMTSRSQQGASPTSWKIYTGTTTEDLPMPVDPRLVHTTTASLTRITMRQLQEPSLDPMFAPLSQFYNDAAQGQLANYVFIEPHLFVVDEETDQHPPADIRPGDALISSVYQALRDSPCWSRVMLIVTYDEHGGCYDHVAPPSALPPDPSAAPGQYGFRFDRLGPRVPAVVISPLIDRGTIFGAAQSPAFDHTSILATLWRRFDLGSPLGARAAAAPDLGFLLTLSEARDDCPVMPVPVARPASVNTPSPTVAQARGTAHLAIQGLRALSDVQPDPEESILSYVARAYGRLVDLRQDLADPC